MGNVVGEQLVGLLVGHTRMDDHVVALLPVDGSSNAVLVSELDDPTSVPVIIFDQRRMYLERVNDAQNLVKRTAGLCRVADRQADDLLRVNHEDRADLQTS